MVKNLNLRQRTLAISRTKEATSSSRRSLWRIEILQGKSDVLLEGVENSYLWRQLRGRSNFERYYHRTSALLKNMTLE